MKYCAVCKVAITKQNIALWDTNKHNAVRLDSFGKEWCQECVDEHDSIDWDKVYEI